MGEQRLVRKCPRCGEVFYIKEHHECTKNKPFEKTFEKMLDVKGKWVDDFLLELHIGLESSFKETERIRHKINNQTYVNIERINWVMKDNEKKKKK